MRSRNIDANAFAGALLGWYGQHARQLPWRVPPSDRAAGVVPDPYRVWLSEVMLQQTTAAAVKSYFEIFTAKWPTVEDLAAASSEDVMRAWAGLGYYSRARNLKAAAEAVAGMGGRFPPTSEALMKLPGIGRYTAAAIAAIAFDRPEPVVDGNVERVIGRLYAIPELTDAAKKAIRAHQADLTPSSRPGDYAQAMMDLGASLCSSKRPACSLCPIERFCEGHQTSNPELFALKPRKAPRPTRFGVAYVVTRPDGSILLRRREERGLLGGMTEVPGSAWTSARPRDPSLGQEQEPSADDESLLRHSLVPASAGTNGNAPSNDSPDGAPLKADWRSAGQVVHVFTHFRLELEVMRGEVPPDMEAPEGCWWSTPADLPDEALPSVMKKVIEVACPGATKKPVKR